MAAVKLPNVDFEVVVDHYEGEPDELGRRSFIEKKIRFTIGKLSSRFGRRIDARLRSGDLLESLYQDTVAEAVLRVVRNPEGFTTEQQGNYQYGLRASVASGYLMFTHENLSDLLGESSMKLGTFTIGDHSRE